jgi:hypothetical protein
VEAAESADFNFVAGSQGTDDAVKYGAHDDFGLSQGHANSLIHLLGQISPSHPALLQLVSSQALQGLL